MIAQRSQRRKPRPRPKGFTLTEVMLVGGLMSLLVILISGIWSGLGRSATDAVSRCRVAQEARLAAAALARDFGGSLPEEPTGQKQCGRLVDRLIVGGTELQLCFDGEPANGVGDWSAPDTVVIYQLQTETTYGKAWKRLVRRNMATGSEFTVATNVDAMELTDQGDGVKIDLTVTYRDITRTFTIIAKDP
jgi:type II secretory pathway component PulJ